MKVNRPDSLVNTNNHGPETPASIEVELPKRATPVAESGKPFPERSCLDRKFPYEWAAMFLPGLKWLFTRRLTGREQIVLAEMLGSIRYKNIIDVPQVLIASITGLDKSHVSKAVAGLRKKEVIIPLEDRSMAGRQLYVLNLRIGYKGTAADWYRAQRARFSHRTRKIGGST